MNSPDPPSFAPDAETRRGCFMLIGLHVANAGLYVVELSRGLGAGDELEGRVTTGVDALTLDPLCAVRARESLLLPPFFSMSLIIRCAL